MARGGRCASLPLIASVRIEHSNFQLAERVMRRFGKCSKQIAGAVLLSAMFAGVASIATTGLADGAKLSVTSVNRTHKSDRLPQASNLQRPENKSNFMK